MMILETPKWNPIRQANFVASLNKMAVDQAKKRYPEMEVPNERPFTCLSFSRKSFVYFPDLKVYQEVFLKMYLGLVRLQEVHCWVRNNCSAAYKIVALLLLEYFYHSFGYGIGQ